MTTKKFIQPKQKLINERQLMRIVFYSFGYLSEVEKLSKERKQVFEEKLLARLWEELGQEVRA